MNAPNSEFFSIQGLQMEVERRGAGSPLLLLLSEEAAFERDAPFVAELASKHQVIIPQPPGFGRSERPEWVSSPDDISYMYLDLVEKLGLSKVPVVGLSLGGFIAAQMAVKDSSFISKLVMVDSFGVKIGGPFDRDVQDIWTSHPDKVAAWKWADPANGKRDLSAKSEDELSIVARNIESFARFCWEPYMHDPKLKARLHRVKAPTLFVWGEKDGVVTTAYGKAYSQLVPGAKFVAIANAGHYPHLEQPAATLKEINAFLG
jgi:pimeloyl-ACP methyl ester carboxylesterase